MARVPAPLNLSPGGTPVRLGCPPQHARRGQRQRHGIAQAERQLRDRARADDFRNRGIVGLNRRGGGLDGDGLRDSADFQLEVGAHGLVDVDLNPRFRYLLKSGLVDGNVVHADAHEIDPVAAKSVRSRRCRVSPVLASTAVILAFGTTLPVASVTVPTSDVVVAIWP